MAKAKIIAAGPANSIQVGTGFQQHVCNLNVDAKIFFKLST